MLVNLIFDIISNLQVWFEDQKRFSRSKSARCLTGSKHSLWSLAWVEMKVHFTLVSQLPGVFPLRRHQDTWKVAKRVSADPFCHHHLCVVHRKPGGSCGELRDAARHPAQPCSKANRSGTTAVMVIPIHGWDLRQTVSLLDSSLLWFKMRFQGRNIHNWQPHQVSEHLCLLCS